MNESMNETKIHCLFHHMKHKRDDVVTFMVWLINLLFFVKWHSNLLLWNTTKLISIDWHDRGQSGSRNVFLLALIYDVMGTMNVSIISFSGFFLSLQWHHHYLTAGFNCCIVIVVLLLFSQYVPFHSSVQLQVNWLSPSLHIPLCWHGSL